MRTLFLGAVAGAISLGASVAVAAPNVEHTISNRAVVGAVEIETEEIDIEIENPRFQEPEGEQGGIDVEMNLVPEDESAPQILILEVETPNGKVITNRVGKPAPRR